MTRGGKFGAVLAGVMVLMFSLTSVLFADETVTGLVVESGFSGVVIKTEGGAAVKYNTGRETVYTPDDYRPLRGDVVSVGYYTKAGRGGNELLVAAAVTLVKKDPNRKELSSPAAGVIREVGRKAIRFEFPATGQVVAMDIKRGMEKVPTGWEPMVGEKVNVHFEKVNSRFGNNIVMVIDKLERVD